MTFEHPGNRPESGESSGVHAPFHLACVRVSIDPRSLRDTAAAELDIDTVWTPGDRILTRGWATSPSQVFLDLETYGASLDAFLVCGLLHVATCCKAIDAARTSGCRPLSAPIDLDHPWSSNAGHGIVLWSASSSPLYRARTPEVELAHR